MTRRSDRRRISLQWCGSVVLLVALGLGACSDDSGTPATPSGGTSGNIQTIDARLIDASERGDLSEVQKLLWDRAFATPMIAVAPR